MSELRECPLCGSKKCKVKDKAHSFYVRRWVECMICHCKSGRYGSNEEAISAWNTRSNAVVALPSATSNTAMLKLPTLEEAEAALNIEYTEDDRESYYNNGASDMYDYLIRQLQQ